MERHTSGPQRSRGCRRSPARRAHHRAPRVLDATDTERWFVTIDCRVIVIRWHFGDRRVRRRTPGGSPFVPPQRGVPPSGRPTLSGTGSGTAAPYTPPRRPADRRVGWRVELRVRDDDRVVAVPARSVPRTPMVVSSAFQPRCRVSRQRAAAGCGPCVPTLAAPCARAAPAPRRPAAVLTHGPIRVPDHLVDEGVKRLLTPEEPGRRGGSVRQFRSGGRCR